MLLLGLTGTIATGKSTVSSLLSAPPHNLPIIDADLLARRVVEPGTAGYKAIVRHFGGSTPDLLLPPEAASADGRRGEGEEKDRKREEEQEEKGRPLNRAALGRRIFAQGNSSDRAALNAIVHPAVRREIFLELAQAYLRGSWAVVLDIPLLFESNWEKLCGCIIVVGVTDPAIQMRRLRERDPHLSEQEARDRVASQVDVREKAERARARGVGWGVVVWNDAGREELRGDVERVVMRLKGGSPEWWGWVLLACPPLAVVQAVRVWGWGWWCQRRWRRERAKL
ncbi:MAG: hypothetical protein M1828_005718 [Chrysothrix sp. TS-e1954]|nr:MAG: hypothetical protein M1828_005718 [Chrysothrix sp. TS-e1954]